MGKAFAVPLKPAPIMSAKPLSKNALAIVMPAPNINKIPHGIFNALTQSSKPSPFSERIINIKTAPNRAMVESPMVLILIKPVQPPNG